MFAGEEPEHIRPDDRAPQARFDAECAVALRGAHAQINVGLVANGAAVAASGVGLQHRVSPCSNRHISRDLKDNDHSGHILSPIFCILTPIPATSTPPPPLLALLQSPQFSP